MAKKDVGFDPAGDKVLIQLYPIKAGGCEIFVTKLGILPEASARLVTKSNTVTLLERKKHLYVFSSLDDLVKAVKMIKIVAQDITPTSDVFVMDDKYFLAIEEYAKGGEPLEFPHVLEFGTELAADILTYVDEHAVLLTDGDGIEKYSHL